MSPSVPSKSISKQTEPILYKIFSTMPKSTLTCLNEPLNSLQTMDRPDAFFLGYAQF